MIIKSATFVTSAVKPSQFPEAGLPEIAFAGRSNVGKSSLINTLVNRKNLVKTSATPGKTRLINFFNINDRLMFVDLPGYGYAKVSRAERNKWGPMVEGYLANRANLKGVVLLMDIRRDPGVGEHDLLHWLQDQGLDFFLVLTKADKLSRSRQMVRQKQIATALGPFVLMDERMIRFSSRTRQGKDAVWKQITHLISDDEEMNAS